MAKRSTALFPLAARATATVASMSVAGEQRRQLRRYERRSERKGTNEPFSNDPTRRATDVLLLFALWILFATVDATESHRGVRESEFRRR